MQVQPRHRTGGNAQSGEVVGVPALPAGADVMVTNVRRVADKRGAPLNARQPQPPVVINDHFTACRHAAQVQVGAQHQRRQWVTFHREQLPLRKRVTCRQNEAPGASARVNEPLHCTLLLKPCQQGCDDRGRRVDRAQQAARLSRAQLEQTFAQRVRASAHRRCDVVGHTSVNGRPATDARQVLLCAG